MKIQLVVGLLFFDNLSIEHKTGHLPEETHYYPFGLTMAGISSKALKPYYAENKYKFNKGTELQNQEFSDGSGLELYETNFRSLDPQLGRFWQIDALGQTLPSLSPYQFANDNPIYFNDPFGLLSDSLHPQELPTVVVTPQKKSDNTSAWGLGWEWMTGSGAREHVIGYKQWWSNNIEKPLNNFFSTGALSPTSQTVEWTETIQWKGDK